MGLIPGCQSLAPGTESGGEADTERRAMHGTVTGRPFMWGNMASIHPKHIMYIFMSNMITI